MSLLAWYQLNENLNNKGIYDGLTTSGSPSYINGKFGKALSLNPRVTFNNLPKLNKFTITFWAKVDSCALDWADLIGFACHQKDDTSAAQFRFEATKTSRSCSFHNNSPYGITSASRILITEEQKGEWHHVGVTYDGTSFTSYADGVKVYTDTGLGGYLISNFYIGENNGVIIGGMNDLRIYDECLSTSEIKEISKGLILHYTFNDNCGPENLVIEGNKISSWTAENCTESQESDNRFKEHIKITTSANDRRIYRPFDNVWTETGVYTVSFYAKSETNGLRVDMSRSITDFTDEFILTTEWKRYVGYINSTLVSSTGTLSFRLRTAGTVYLANVKLERGENPNPIYSPNKSDSNYSSFELDVVHDSSGYGHNGQLSTGDNSISFVKDSKSGDYSAYLKQNSIITTDKLFYDNNDQCHTVCAWFKKESNTDTNGILINFNKSYYIKFNSSNQALLYINSGTVNDSYIYSKSINGNNWHHIAFVFNQKNDIRKVYLDGIDYSSHGPSISGKTPAGFQTSTIFGTNFIGNLDDIRVYATALSAEDIKSLYEVKAKIDKNGNIFCNQFNEIDNERNLLDTDQYWISGKTTGSYTQEKIECNDSSTGFATKITCTEAGSGFYMSGHKVFNKTDLIHGKQYVVSLYAKSDNRTTINLNVECASQQSKGQFTIGNTYRRLFKIFTYSNTTQYYAFTSYSNWKINENLYIHSIKVTEYNPKSYFKNNGTISANNFIEINSEQEAKIYKQDIQANEFIEI